MSTLALSMIVRNGAADLRACLASARPFVDKIVVADTGSNDRSIEIAQQFGARVIQIPWEDDFAKARNLSLAEVTTDWVLSLDADERLDPQEARRLAELMGAVSGSYAAGYQVTIRNYVRSAQERLWDQPARPNDGSFAEAAGYPAYLEHQNVRLFRRDPEVYFVHRVHESVGPRILALGRPLGDAGFLIHHFGLAVQGDERRRKNELYRRMGEAKVRENPRNAQAHFELGLELFEHFGAAEEASKSFKRAAQLNPNLSVAWLFQGLACLKLGQDARAVECLRRARRGVRDTALIAESEGDAHYNLGDCPAAERAYRRALELAPESATVESKLGLTCVRAGRGDEGLDLLLRALQRQPSQGHLYDRLVAATVSLNRLEDAALAAECKLNNTPPDADGYLRAAVLRHRSGNGPRAVALLQAGLSQFPEAAKLRQGLVELLA
jgi:tetratricopeptide (TPR) repeat protein